MKPEMNLSKIGAIKNTARPAGRIQPRIAKMRLDIASQ